MTATHAAVAISRTRASYKEEIDATLRTRLGVRAITRYGVSAYSGDSYGVPPAR
jgi:hypothetical protein